MLIVPPLIDMLVPSTFTPPSVLVLAVGNEYAVALITPDDIVMVVLSTFTPPS